MSGEQIFNFRLKFRSKLAAAKFRNGFFTFHFSNYTRICDILSSILEKVSSKIRWKVKLNGRQSILKYSFSSYNYSKSFFLFLLKSSIFYISSSFYSLILNTMLIKVLVLRSWILVSCFSNYYYNFYFSQSSFCVWLGFN